MKRLFPFLICVAIAACGEDTHPDTEADAANDMVVSDMATSDMTSSDRTVTDMTADDMDPQDMAAQDMNSQDMDPQEAAQDMTAQDMTDGGETQDMASTDSGNDVGNADDMGMDMTSGGYDTTGWTMKKWTKNESASSGTPDSYFFDVDSGSPLSASIVGGGGSWSVNVFGGMSNQLQCTGTSSCQVMLNPLDTVVVITAITTGIGSYTLTVDYAGMGPR